MLGQPTTGWCQPNPSTIRLDQRRTRFASQDGDALGDARGGRAELGRHLVHRPEARELQEETQATEIHWSIVWAC
ncbi:hypothetical protein JCM18899A_31090 [Nocardioides sp. AN3]